jgi:hypothetical protein
MLFPSYLLVGTFHGFSQNLIKKQQVAASHFSKEFCACLKKASRKREIVLSCFQKSFVN